MTAVGVLGAPSTLAQTDTEVTVTMDPLEPTTPVDDTVTVDVVIRGATEGISGYEFTLQVDDPTVGTVTLELVDENGDTDSATREVSVEEQTGPAPPSAAFEVTSTDPVVGETVTLDAAASEGDIVSYDWAFGDGSEMTTDEPTVTPATPPPAPSPSN